MLTAKEISDFVDANREEAIRCLQELVSCPSVTGNEKPVSLIYKKWMEDNGFAVRVYEAEPDRPNLFADWYGSQPGKRFVFNGHMDVFPPDETGMPYGPWSAEIHDGKLYGRGASDMKGGDAIALMATIFLKRMGFDPKGSVLLSWMCDEERGSRLGVIADLKAGLIEGDFGICPEATDGYIVHKHGGIIRGHVTYTAVAQHTGIPYQYGENALVKAHRAIGELLKISDRLAGIPAKGDVPPPCFTISVINSGEAANVHPSKATFWFDRRLVPGEDHDAAYDEIVQTLENLKNSREGYDYELVVTNDRPLLDIDDDDPFIKLCQASYEKVMGKPVRAGFGAGGSDAAWIRKVTGMPMPNFSPAVRLGAGGSGAADEYMPIEGYIDFIKVFMMIVHDALS